MLRTISPKGTLRSLKRKPSAWLGSTAMFASLLLAGLLVVASVLAFGSAREEARADRWETHTRQVLVETAALRLATLSVVRGERGYLLTEDEDFLQPYLEGRQAAEQSLGRLGSMIIDNPAQMRRLGVLQERVEQHLAATALVISLTREGSAEAAVERISSGLGRDAIEHIMSQIDEIETQENALLESRRQQAQIASYRSSRFVQLLGLAGLLLLAVGIVFAIALRRSLTREEAAMEQLRHIATTDELTGLANRRELFRSLDRRIAGAKRSGRPLSIAILDIDRFKRVNDTHGHAVGDEVIRAVADTAMQVVRELDVVGRLGGEEFVIVFPDCDAPSAVAACERLRQAITFMQVSLENGGTLNVTLSSGVAVYGEGDDSTALIARADQALYEAKAGGRNQVRLAA